jgi:misacylated tRNA(Ala) deacylase
VAAQLYLVDPYLTGFSAVVTASQGGWVSLDRTAFYPGGGGQPADRGRFVVAGTDLLVSEVRADPTGEIWHRVEGELTPGSTVEAELDWSYRYALMRAHGLMHVVNTVARASFAGAITGVQLGAHRSRIDLRLEGFGRDRLVEFEDAVNVAVGRDLAITARTIEESEYRARPELIRTVEALPPVEDGRVRIVEIAGFDAQACGGTHVHSMAEIGVARLTKFENKGRDNKRFYWELNQPTGSPG